MTRLFGKGLDRLAPLGRRYDEEGTQAMRLVNGVAGVGWLSVALCLLACWSLVVLAIGLIFRVSRSVAPPRLAGQGAAALDPAQVAAQRFACGELDEAAYQARGEAVDDVR